MDAVVEQFADLFEGRRDAYGTEEGGCFRPAGIGKEWWSVANAHLKGDLPIGVYPMVYRPPCSHEMGWCVKWGAVDFDVKTKGKPSWDYEDEAAAHVAACDLRAALSHVGIESWIERTRSYGRHVWVFSEQWVTAKTMRRALLMACSVASVSTREVNPKQEALQPNQLGNYVRLPYPGMLSVAPRNLTNRCMVVAHERYMHGDQIPLASFVRHAIESRTPTAMLEKIAAKYKEPEKPKFDLTPMLRITSSMPWQRLNAAGKYIWANGPADGDRSRALGYLAYQARLSGLTQTEAYQLLQSCGFNKFAGRNDEEIRLQQIVMGAWA